MGCAADQLDQPIAQKTYILFIQDRILFGMDPAAVKTCPFAPAEGSNTNAEGEIFLIGGIIGKTLFTDGDGLGAVFAAELSQQGHFCRVFFQFTGWEKYNLVSVTNTIQIQNNLIFCNLFVFTPIA